MGRDGHRVDSPATGLVRPWAQGPGVGESAHRVVADPEEVSGLLDT